MKQIKLILVYCFSLMHIVAQNNNAAYIKPKANTSARIGNLNAVAKTITKTGNIYFFESFLSPTKGGDPDTNKWYNGGGVKINNNTPKYCPDLNAAIFDGTDKNFIPYDFENPLSRGVTDSLVSHYIDLSDVIVPSTPQDSLLALSFFVQNGGNGEIADGRKGDQISLSFKNKNGQWVQVWARQDSLPSIADTLVVDLYYKEYFAKHYKPIRFLNTLTDSLNYLKKVYPTIANFSIDDKVVKDSMAYFYGIWNGNHKFVSSDDSIKFYRDVYRNDADFLANYRSFFTDVYHRSRNFYIDTLSVSPLVLRNDSIEYFKKMFPNEFFPEQYYKVYFGKISGPLEGYHDFTPRYKNFVSNKALIDAVKLNGSIPNQKKQDSIAVILARAKRDSILHFRDYARYKQSEAYDNFTKYEYQFNKSTDTAYFHDKFQMAFVSKGRMSGGFDVWALDFIFLRRGKIDSHNMLPRRIMPITGITLSMPQFSILKNYASMPLRHVDDATVFRDTIVYRQYNLGKLADAPFEVGHFTFNKDEVAITAPSLGEFGSNDVPFLDHTLSLAKPLLDTSLDSVIIDSYVYLTGASDTTDPITFENNMIKSSTVFSNYYAYDDGSADRAFELPGRYSELAYKFRSSSSIEDTLTQIRIYFPKIVRSNDTKSFALNIWKKISNPGEGRREDLLLYSDTVVVDYARADSLEGFNEFDIYKPVMVKDSFYVGYELLTAEPIYIGYDVNPTLNSATNIYYNSEGDWKQYRSSRGNLMIRPVFGKFRAEQTGREGSTKATKMYDVYPNPTEGKEVHVKGPLPIRLRMYDLLGAEQTSFSYDGDTGTVSFDGMKPGLYTLKIIGNDAIVYKKIIVN